MLLEDKIQPVYLSSSAHNEWRPSTDHLWRIWSDWFFFIGKWEIWKGNAFSAIFVRRLHIEAREREKKNCLNLCRCLKGQFQKDPHDYFCSNIWNMTSKGDGLLMSMLWNQKHWRLWTKSTLKCFWKSLQNEITEKEKKAPKIKRCDK